MVFFSFFFFLRFVTSSSEMQGTGDIFFSVFDFPG